MQLTKTGDVAYVTLSRPEVLNALNHELRMGLIETLTRCNDDEATRVVVLRGEGRAFCAGQDQKESSQFDHDGAALRIEMYGRLFSVLRDMSKPTIAKIKGYSVGAGFQVALLCDLRIAADTAKVGMTELNIGSPCITGSGILRQVAGSETPMKWLVLTGELISAAEAKSYNLVHEVVADEALDDRVDAVACIVAQKAPLALRLTKEWWRAMTREHFDATMKRAHSAHAENFARGGIKAGSTAFLARKRAGGS